MGFRVRLSPVGWTEQPCPAILARTPLTGLETRTPSSSSRLPPPGAVGTPGLGEQKKWGREAHADGRRDSMTEGERQPRVSGGEAQPFAGPRGAQPAVREAAEAWEVAACLKAQGG